MNKTDQDPLERVSAFLPDAMAKALTSYQKFSQETEANDVKDFADFHKACRVAISHIELLVKMARIINSPGQFTSDTNSQVVLAALVAEAEEELRGYRQEK